MWTFEFYQFISKKVTLTGLNSLWQKNCQVSVKIWSFDDLIPKKGPALIILVPMGIKYSKSGSFLRKKGFWGHRGHRCFWGCWGQCLLCQVFYARKITNEFFRVNQVLGINDLMTNITLFCCFKKIIVSKIIKYQAEFWYSFLSEAVEASQCYFFWK